MLGFVRRHPLLTGGLVLGTAVAAGTLAESRLDPVGWNAPDPPPMTGALEPDHALADADRVVTCDGPEDTAFDAEGRLYTGADDGVVYRTVEPVDGDTDCDLEPFARVGGRPLGLVFAEGVDHGEPGSDLLVAAEDAGLVRVTPDGETETLTDSAAGQHTQFADDLYVRDGVVYLTDATVHEIFQDELFELQDTGRLLAYDLETDETRVELTGLGFANGVAPGPDGESLLVNETSRYRIRRYWVAGDRAGEDEVFVDNLPGYPDNVDVASGGGYWVAIPSLRDESLEALQRRPWVKRQLGKLPEAVLQQVSGDAYGLVLRVDASGEVVDSLHDPGGNVFGVTSATEHDGALYLGSLFDQHVHRHELATG
jgi:hypothetical protein